MAKDPQRRHRSYTESHAEIVATAVRLISRNGVAALSLAEIARDLGIDRSTVYYHFKNREALIAEVKAWSSAEMTKAFSREMVIEERIDYTTEFVLDHPELAKLWIDEFISEGDIRDSFPGWDAMIEGFRANAKPALATVDAEIYFVNILTSAIISPRVFRNRIDRQATKASIVERFRREWLRLIAPRA
jgi:AcrR family transcriptional regulator